MLKKLFLTAVSTLSVAAMLTVAACSDKSTDEGDAAELTGNTPTQQTFYADETQKSGSIAFKAKTSWTASVFELTTKTEEGRVAWLSLNQYSGTAGNVALALTLEKNMTGNDRKAEIRIVCGPTVLRITVEQKATKEDGSLPEEKPDPDDPNDPDNPDNPDDPNNPENPDNPDNPDNPNDPNNPNNPNNPDNPDNPENPENPENPDDPNNPDNPENPEKPWQITRIDYEPNDNGTDRAYFAFDYDTTDRLIKFEYRAFYYDKDLDKISHQTDVFRITYGNKSVAYELTCLIGDKAMSEKPTGSIVLNENNRAISGTYTDYGTKNTNQAQHTSYVLSLNEDGNVSQAYCSKDHGEEASRELNYTTFWQDGNPFRVYWGRKTGDNFFDEATYNTIENNTNIDLNWLFLTNTAGWGFSGGDPERIFAMLGYIGRAHYFIDSVTSKETYRSFNYTYETDDKGRPIKIRSVNTIQQYSGVYTITYAE